MITVMSASLLVESCCTDRSNLCGRCRADTFRQLRGVAATRGEVWAMSLVGRIPASRTWDPVRVRAIALDKIDDLGRDSMLVEMLASEFAHWATRWWASASATPAARV